MKYRTGQKLICTAPRDGGMKSSHQSKLRVPRKKKKQAKKLKAAVDAMILTQAAMVSAMGMAQMAIISALPSALPAPVTIAEKALKAASVAVDSAKAVQNVMSQIKPWYEYVPNFKR